MSDEELQKIFDKGNYNDTSEIQDRELYTRLYKFLEEETSFQPRPGFAHRVTSQIQTEKKGHAYTLYIPLIAGFCLLMAGLVFIIFWLDISVEFTGFTPKLFIMLSITVLVTSIYKFLQRKLQNSSDQEIIS